MRRHWPFALLAAAALPLLFANLGSDCLWADEGDTAVLASNILKFGLPSAWDGVTFIDSDRGARLNEQLVMVSHPWVQYYVAAGSFLVFGENTFAARAPFALAGWATIFLSYTLVLRLTGKRTAAFGAATLLVFSVPFLLYARQCRNYSVNMFLTCALVSIFFQMRSTRAVVLFAIVAVLLFHTHPAGILPIMALGVLTLFHRPFAAQRRRFWLVLPAIAILTVPWGVRAATGYNESTELISSLRQLPARFAQYAIECASVTPLAGCMILLVVSAILAKRRRESERDPLDEDQTGFVLITSLTIVGYGMAMAASQSIFTMWHIGIRQTAAVVPLVAMLTAIMIAKLSRPRFVVAVPLLVLFNFTTLAGPRLWTFWNRGPSALNSGEAISLHVPNSAIACLFPTEQLFFLRDLARKNPGTVSETSAFLRQHLRAGERLIANYEWEPLYFHTRLPQALKIFADYPIYEAARRRGLPDYVFGIDGVRWIVWRPFWESYQGYRAADVQRQIVDRGGRLTPVGEFKETIWENRENIHFRRFSDDRYLFAWFVNPPAATIFRVDWPDNR